MHQTLAGRIASHPRVRIVHVLLLSWLAWTSLACNGRCSNAATPPASTPSQLAQQSPSVQPQAPEPPAPFPEARPAYFDSLVSRAREDAASPPRDDSPIELPASLQGLNAHQYASIRFRPERSLWRDQSGKFEVQFFHLGSHYKQPVAVFELDSMQSREPTEVRFSTDLFSYDGVQAPPADARLGFAGLRVHAPLNRNAYKDELIVFQGATYWRALGRGNAFGLSGRGLALDTGEPSGEEFPRFTEMYLVTPGEDDASVWILARLDSRRATGAYAFRVTPGEPTLVDVSARVFFREPVKLVGVAPLTSMFMFDEQHPGRFGDYRPEVHDSDGLALQTRNGERIFRPLRNPPSTTMSAFQVAGPQGFGLLQRDREFTHYQDLRERYQDRPSAYVEPVGDWGEGSVRLYEIATTLESDDNIGAFWRPEVIPDDGLDVRYRVHVGDALPTADVFGRVASTHRQATASGMSFLVDFDTAQTQPPPASEVQLEVSAVGGRVLHSGVQENPYMHGLRAAFEVTAEDPAKGVELRAYLRRGADVLTETWSYLWQPDME